MSGVQYFMHRWFFTSITFGLLVLTGVYAIGCNRGVVGRRDMGKRVVLEDLKHLINPRNMFSWFVLNFRKISFFRENILNFSNHNLKLYFKKL
jgi:hypothetical protein